MAASPDLAGFRDATERKRSFMSADVIFRGEPEVTFAPGTPLDPETGKPYDPVLVGSAVTASATLRCEIAYRVRGDQLRPAPIGWMENTDVMLIADPEAAATASGMVEFQARGDWYEIRAQKFDGVVDIDRYLIWGAQK